MTDPRDTPPPAASDIGRLVGGRYLLGDLLGLGGMATVHRALDTKLDRPVAIKLLRREVVADADIAMRFRREALAATVLRHPNIVACLEAGTDDGQPFLVMELVEGEDLAARLRRSGRLAPAEAARIGLDVARALGVAHIRGIVHRDVKPGNILLGRDGRAMVTDFGIARLAADAEGAVPGTTLGSVHYFSPEQSAGATTSAASDVYSLGLVLFECLTGTRAWSGDTTAKLAAVRIGAVAPSPRAVRPEVPEALDAVVMRAMDPDPSRRYPNGNALTAALEPFVARPDPTSPTTVVDTAALAAGAAALTAAQSASPAVAVAPPLQPRPAFRPAPAPARTAPIRRTSPAIAGPLAVLLLVIGVVAGGLFVASLPGRGGAAVAVGSPTPRPTRTPTPTAKPTAVPTPTPVPDPTPVPEPTARPPGSGAGDLCQPIFGLACGLGAGTYEPASFEPAIGFELGDGWSTAIYEPNLVGLSRNEGSLTLASTLTTVYSDGEAEEAPDRARDVAETFIATDGVAAGRPDEIRIDKRRTTIVNLETTGPDRVPLFGAGDQVYYLEPFGTTRVFIVDGKDGVLIIAVEPGEDSALEDLLPAAESVIESFGYL